MGKKIRLMAALLALCVLAGGVAMAEDCGIGEAAEYAPAFNAAVSPAEVMPTASGKAEGTETFSDKNPLEDESSIRGFVYRMYKTVLGREPEPEGLEAWTKALETGRYTAADLVLGFFNSGEYTRKAKKSEDIVRDCYETMLNREADKDGLEAWKKVLDVGMSSDVVCAGFVYSKEFETLAAKYGLRPGTVSLTKARDQNYERTAFVYRLYQDCLNRTPDLAGLEQWCATLGIGSDGTSVAKGFIFSSEYKNKLADNQEFVTMLYRTIMGRAADTAGLGSWADLLNYTATREKVLNGFMFSAEFAEKCAKAGINVGKKIYEPDTSAEWQANITVLSMVNHERAMNGLPALVTREDLWERVAMVRAKEVKESFSHTRPDGSEWYTAYWDAGFPDAKAAENIAHGYRTASAVMSAWMNSRGHRENILSTACTTLATGLFGRSYWSQNFYDEK